jgi:hypothetical protein
VLDATPTHHSTYVYGELSGGIPGTPITLHSHLGHTGGGFNYTKQYIDYNVGASLTWKNLTFDAVGTNVSKSDGGGGAVRRPDRHGFALRNLSRGQGRGRVLGNRQLLTFRPKGRMTRGPAPEIGAGLSFGKTFPRTALGLAGKGTTLGADVQTERVPRDQVSVP